MENDLSGDLFRAVLRSLIPRSLKPTVACSPPIEYALQRSSGPFPSVETIHLVPMGLLGDLWLGLLVLLNSSGVDRCFVSGTIRTHLLPALTTAEALSGGVVVVIDVLRATTTITQALASGAVCVVPCLEVEEAQAWRNRDGQAVLGGERRSVAIEGFDLGNSPLDYTPQVVQGRRVVITTTNGTRALAICRSAQEVLLGCFANRQAVVEALIGTSGDIHILCAGTDGQITREDLLFAGAVAAGLLQQTPTPLDLDDPTLLALAAWESVEVLQLRYGLQPEELPEDPLAPAWLVAALLTSQGGRNLKQVGLVADVAVAARLDTLPLVPKLDLQKWEITARLAQTPGP